MATERKIYTVYIERVMVMPIRIGYRFARDHFLLFSSTVFMFLLYSSCPSLFSFLVSNSPILICTTLLLGLLLSYGESNSPYIDRKDDRKIQEVFRLKSRTTVDGFHNKKYVNFTLENHAVNGTDIKEFAAQEPLLGEENSEFVYHKEEAPFMQGTQYKGSEMEATKSTVNDEGEATPYKEKLTQEGGSQSGELFKSREIDLDKPDEVSEELGTDFRALSAVNKDKNTTFMSEIHSGSLGLAWQLVGSQDLSDTESDQAESSSSDTSMTKVNLLLNEFESDRLLNEESSQRSKDDEDAAADQGSSLVDESGDDTGDEGAEGIEGGGDGVHREKVDGSEAAVEWTADDQKSVMDIGYSEVERNERLRNLILRRQAKKNMMLNHSNLIDLDWEPSSFRFHIPPVSVRRYNPFETSESEESTDLPPIPGSAPSSFVPRRNPFDMLYDHEDENSNLVGETQSHQEKLPVVPSRETIFRRTETFTLSRRQFLRERRHSLLNPYFMTDPDEESSFHYQRQFSDRSDSMVSTVPESDMVSSLADPEYQRHHEADAEEEDIFIDAEQKDDEQDIFIDAKQKDENETDDHEFSLKDDLVTYNSTQAFSALSVEKVSNALLLNETFYSTGTDADYSLKMVEQSEKLGADSSPSPFREDSTASVISSAVPVQNHGFTGLHGRTESLDSSGYESLSELQSDLRHVSSSDLLRGDKNHSNENDLMRLDSSDEESEVVQTMIVEADEIYEEILSELDVVGDFHPMELTSDHQGSQMRLQSDSAGTSYRSLSSYVPVVPVTQIPEVRYTSYDNMSSTPISKVDLQKPIQENSISIDQNITDSGVTFIFGSFGDLEQTVYNPKRRILQVGFVQDIDSHPLKEAMESSVSDPNAKMPIMVKFHPETSETGISSIQMEKTLLASELIVDKARSTNDIQPDFEPMEEEKLTANLHSREVHSELGVVDAQPVDNLHLAAKQISDGTGDKESKATEAMDKPVEVSTVERHWAVDVPDMQFINDEKSIESNFKGDKKAEKSGAKTEHYIPTTKKVYGDAGTAPRVEPAPRQDGIAARPKTGDQMARSTVTRSNNRRGQQKVIQQWRRVTPPSPSTAQMRQDITPTVNVTPKLAGEVTNPNSASQQHLQQDHAPAPGDCAPRDQEASPDPASSVHDQVPTSVHHVLKPEQEAIPDPASQPQDQVQQLQDIPSVGHPGREEAVPYPTPQLQEVPLVYIPQLYTTPQTGTLTLEQQADAAEKAPELLDKIPAQLRQFQRQQEEEEKAIEKPVHGASASGIENSTNDLWQSDQIFEPLVVLMENVLEPEEVTERLAGAQQQEEKKKKKKKKNKSSNSRNYCFHCGESDHQRDTCPLGAPVCYHCLQSGHGFKECPKKLQEEANSAIQRDTPADALAQEDPPASSDAVFAPLRAITFD